LGKAAHGISILCLPQLPLPLPPFSTSAQADDEGLVPEISNTSEFKTKISFWMEWGEGQIHYHFLLLEATVSCPGEPSRQRTGVALNLGKTATSQMSNWELGGSVRGCVMTRGRRWKEQGL